MSATDVEQYLLDSRCEDDESSTHSAVIGNGALERCKEYGLLGCLTAGPTAAGTTAASGNERGRNDTHLYVCLQSGCCVGWVILDFFAAQQ